MSKREESRTENKKPGRPAGAENISYDIVDAPPTACRKCGSTKRAPYFGKPRKLVQRLTDVIVTTIWRRTKCLKPGCGQFRMDKTQHREPVSASMS